MDRQEHSNSNRPVSRTFIILIHLNLQNLTVYFIVFHHEKAVYFGDKIYKYLIRLEMSFFPRFIHNQLSAWHSYPDRKPLLLRGARQVGKSHAVRAWCQQANLKLLEMNFEEVPRLATVFDHDLDVLRIARELASYFGETITSPSTVLFLDEIQVAPKAITALRYFYEKSPETTVVAAGSLVEFALEGLGLPVGRVHSSFVYPLTFVEFLRAIGKNGLALAIEEFDVQTPMPLPQLIHSELLLQLKTFFRVGGMPKAVVSFSESNDLARVSAEHALLLRGYRDDFRKYARQVDWALLETIFEKMGQLAGGAPVRYSKIVHDLSSTQVRRALAAISMSLVAHKILPVSTPKLPLAAHSIDKRFKLMFLDIGLLHHILGFDWRNVDPNSDLTEIADGRLAEQFVAQELIASRSSLDQYKLHYWNRMRAGSEAEVDFVIEQCGAPVPIEVKSGARGRLRSLDEYIREEKPERCFVLSQRNVEVKENVFFLPLYLAGRL